MREKNINLYFFIIYLYNITNYFHFIIGFTILFLLNVYQLYIQLKAHKKINL